MSAPDALNRLIQRQMTAAGGWLAFDRFMAMALYAPGSGYYSGPLRKLGLMPESGSDFVTAPEMSPWFGRALARSVREALTMTQTSEVWEFGAGSGALALQMIETLGEALTTYHIVDLSGDLRRRQHNTLQAHAERVVWHDELPDRFNGVVLGNELLDAMPVQLLVRKDRVWHERGVVAQIQADHPWAWSDRVTTLRPPIDIEGEHDYLTEIHPQAEAFVRTLAQRLSAGAVFLLDYGFPEREYYHPQRHMGTLMCHQGHRSDTNPLVDVGDKDITAHVNFTSVAVSAPPKYRPPPMGAKSVLPRSMSAVCTKEQFRCWSAMARRSAAVEIRYGSSAVPEPPENTASPVTQAATPAWIAIAFEGATFGYPLLTKFAGSLFKFTDGLTSPNERQLALIKAHADWFDRGRVAHVTGIADRKSVV